MASADPPAPYGMEALATLPVFFKLKGRTVLMAGSGAPAVWKAELIAAAGAQVQVYDAAPTPEMSALVQRLSPGRIALVRRDWSPTDLAGAALAIGAFEDDGAAATFQAAAHQAGVPVNIIDKPEFCDFQFGTILARSPIVIGISTDGAAPVFGQALRARIEAVLPADLGRWAEAAQAWRPAVQALGLDFRGRRRFWEAFSRQALAGGEPSAAVRRACLDAATAEREDDGRGGLTLVGSGQGTAETITLGAIAALQAADCVLHDPDVSSAVVSLARREADKRTSDMVDLGEVARLARNKRVVWLGTGDPATCERWQHRRQHLAEMVADLASIGAPALCPACPTMCRFRATGG